METIKICTDRSQSQKLAEILPLESADMYWMHGKLDNVKQHPTPNIIGNDHDEPLWDDYDVPCWSLSALLGILNENKICHYNDRYYCQYIREGDEFPIYSTAAYNNPVDACYEMILKLHEIKML